MQCKKGCHISDEGSSVPFGTTRPSSTFSVRFAAAPDGSLYALGRALSRSLPNGRYFVPSALFEPKKYRNFDNL